MSLECKFLIYFLLLYTAELKTAVFALRKRFIKFTNVFLRLFHLVGKTIRIRCSFLYYFYIAIFMSTYR